MDNHPLDDIFSLAEQAYARRQAEDALLRCLEQGSLSPVQVLVEDLVLSGGHSVGALNELLNEAESHHAQIQDDLQRAYLVLQGRLERQYGVDLRSLADGPAALVSGSLGRFQEHLAHHEQPEAVLEMIAEARDTLEGLTAQMRLMQAVLTYVDDWLWGMARQWMQTLPSPFPGGRGLPGEYVQ